jgi:aldose 1-epimerase
MAMQTMKMAVLTMAMGVAMAGAQAMAATTVSKADFGKLPDGKAAEVYTLKDADLTVRITTYGARIVSIDAKDKNGKPADVVLGYDSVDGYTSERSKTYFGSIVGRYGNRIAGGQFKIDGQTYTVPKNDGGNALHGGPHGFDEKAWTGKQIPGGVEFTLVSPDGDMGFPGTLTAHVRYTLVGSALHINYSATTDKATVVNLTNHSYFNLGGRDSGSILDDVMMINADKYTPVNRGLIPEGGAQTVEGTPFDFRKPTPIGQRIHDDNAQLKIAGGYDHNWVLNGKNGELKVAAKVVDPKSGRVLTVSTTQPGVQFYTGNFLNGTRKSPDGTPYAKNSGFCLETQHFPDSPNQPAFPTTLLKPGETMHSETVFTFSVEK